mmetsp:Transcript_7128/g.18276  ORF Transcript_7128/g.18276 Transcript_7128/m.18276 type:complete len:136 (-) Transcript_7128:200-607(-)
MAAPRVGIGVLLFRGEQVLVGRRLAKTGKGEFALPGGHLEYGESLEGCAARELAEETGIALPPEAFAHCAVENCVFEHAHYVTIFMRAAAPQEAEAANLEPHKCEGWAWVDWPGGVPAPVFEPLQLLIDRGTVAP